MASTLSAAPNDDHPLALELSSLRAAVARYQHEAHATSLKLQRHSLETSQALDYARLLERENLRLKEEVAVLRSNPDCSPAAEASQVPELTLALRRLSDKLTAVEEAHLSATKNAVDLRSELANTQYEIDAARALAAEAQAREEEGLARERDLEQKLRAAEEERRLADLVVQEYADLVRKLEGRPKSRPTHSSSSSVDLRHPVNGASAALVDTLSEGKLGLHKLLEEFNGRSERLQTDIAKLHGDNGLLYKELEVARQGAEHDRSELAKAMHELAMYRADDNTATKMVSRYMKFSQTSTNALQKAVDTLKLRHATTLATLNAEISDLQRTLSHEREETERIRSALDELTEDIAREAFGRRREVSLRLAFLGREENLAESLRRWIRRAEEYLERSSGSTEDETLLLDPVAIREAFARAMTDAKKLLDTLNTQPSPDDGDPSGSIARLVLAQDTVVSLTHELQEETVRRLKTERKFARLEVADHDEGTHGSEDIRSVAQPVPHRVGKNEQESQLLDLGTESTPNEPSPAVTVEQPTLSKESSESTSVPIVEVVTVPAVAEEPSIAPSVEEPTISAPEATVRPDSSPQLPSVSPSPIPSPPHPSLEREESPEPYTPQDSMAIQPITSGVASVEPPLVMRDADVKPVIQLTNGDTAPIPFPSDSSHDVSLADDGGVLFPVPVPDSPQAPVKALHTSKQHAPPPLPLEASNGSALSSLEHESLELAITAHTPFREPRSGFPVEGLAQVKHRYDETQRGFRDCSLALRELKKHLSDLPSSSAFDLMSTLSKAIDHLIDVNEDARVELEIRIADEERVASGYEALLSIPGAMAHSDDDGEKVDENEMIQEVRAFVDGSDRIVAKAKQQFAQKLDDLEHDIASIKQTLHEITLSGPDSSLSPSASMSSAKSTSSWSAWTPSFLSPPRSTSPAPPTFGSVMTSPRLRHSTSFSHPRENSNDDSPIDPLASLGLRLVVPVRSPTYGAGLCASPGGGPRVSPRQRTTSGMFVLGLGGMRSTSFGPSIGRQGLQKMPSRSSLVSSSTPRLTSSLSLSNMSPEKAASGPRENDSDVE